MDGRMDLSALERTRLLSSLSSGSLAHLSSSISGTSITDSVAQLRSAADRSSTETASPLLEYSRGFLPPGALFPPSSGYGAMMASYLTGSGHVPDSLKHLLPEMRQYWGANAHSESYARYLLGTMYNPYLPYLPATESLALFAQSSASSSQLEALHAHAAVQHRIYDLQKEALYGQGPFSPGLHPHLHLLHNPGGQAEPTNLSISSSKAKNWRRETWS
ncbi:uncharacterized protein LOC127866245 [Dreissena polymorpha]|uniref:Uncharacterized protein n=1 Tax=Dreissena polymorpha TaxID=45954 RepID=A0A9D4LP84_DREPO|nr:uncharacterized protein LOC127866245 [Dreissena polymorpha]XP_052262633.1 uncharacterized protein LOC127866245 [Dreissena polymorpha]KAH3862432.1 hypothetical protein DPMN_025399 [Dreissena polymorpha]